MDDHHFKKEELESVGGWSKVCSQIVLKCLHLARVGRSDILSSVNKLARSVTNWSGACDKRFARLISYIHHTSEYRQHCHMGNTAQHCRWGLFQDSDFAGHLEDSKSTSEGSYVSLKVEHSSPIVGCARNKRQYPQFYSGSEIISLDAGLRVDGLPALDLWDVVMELLRSSNNTKPPTNPAAGTVREITPQTYTLLKVGLSCTSLKTMNH